MSNLTMKEAAKAWGEGKEVEWSNQYQFNGKWQPILPDGFYFNEHCQYRLKPEVTTSLQNSDLRKVYYRAFNLPDYRPDDPKSSALFEGALRAVADAAIKQYIKESQNKA